MLLSFWSVFKARPSRNLPKHETESFGQTRHLLSHCFLSERELRTQETKEWNCKNPQYMPPSSPDPLPNIHPSCICEDNHPHPHLDSHLHEALTSCPTLMWRSPSWTLWNWAIAWSTLRRFEDVRIRDVIPLSFDVDQLWLTWTWDLKEASFFGCFFLCYDPLSSCVACIQNLVDGEVSNELSLLIFEGLWEREGCRSLGLHEDSQFHHWPTTYG